MLIILLIVFNIFTLNACNCDIKNKAVVISPIVEGSGMSIINSDLDINSYNRFAYSLKSKSYECPRLHQLLFNEIVTIKKENGDEVECEMPTFFYYGKNLTPTSTLWILKKHLKPLKFFKENNLMSSIPRPYNCILCQGLKNANLKDILTLKHGYLDKETNTHYSAGTRFNRALSFDSKDNYGVFIFDPSTNKTKNISIPKNISIVNYGGQKQQIQNFLNLLKEYAYNKNYIIPYVWGGASLTNHVKDLEFFIDTKLNNNKKIEAWERNSDFPSGLDCSGLILRAAQICGMPYFYKNTLTLSKNLKPLGKDESLSNGDLIWYQGHVLIVSDIKKNEVIESAGYEYGYGKVHAIKLPDLFKNINTYKDLIDAYNNKSELIRLKKDGSFGRKIHSFLLLKIDSIY